jgi:DNA-binding HxlR family transcriptional regulator
MVKKLKRCFMLTKEELPECPVATTVQLIGNKWKLLIIRNLLASPQRFGDFLKTIPGISKKVLTDNLRALEEDGIVSREVFAEVPPKVVYSLTPLGDSLRPILEAMKAWGNDYKQLG